MTRKERGFRSLHKHANDLFWRVHNSELSDGEIDNIGGILAVVVQMLEDAVDALQKAE